MNLIQIWTFIAHSTRFSVKNRLEKNLEIRHSCLTLKNPKNPQKLPKIAKKRCFFIFWDILLYWQILKLA